jgi:hypothetical protein
MSTNLELMRVTNCVSTAISRTNHAHAMRLCHLTTTVNLQKNNAIQLALSVSPNIYHTRDNHEIEAHPNASHETKVRTVCAAKKCEMLHVMGNHAG